jgi:hypothetical protein
MADTDDQPENRSGWRLKPWQGRLIAGFLIIGGVEVEFSSLSDTCYKALVACGSSGSSLEMCTR